jgi:hypothetical protein
MTLIFLFAPLTKQKPVNLFLHLKLKGFFFRTERKNFVLDRNVVKNALKIHAYEDVSLWNVITCRLVNCYRRFERP